MQQLTQKLKDGTMRIVDVPVPALQKGHVLIRNHYSLVSAGTEGSTVKAARKSLIGKAKERPQQVKQVIDVLKSQGPVQTYRAVMKKLDALSPLGYSCAGEVIDVAPDVTTFAVGDLVACGGLTASHAEVVAVPKNLCVRLEPDADLKAAAYNTLGAIAMQSVRQADLKLGETCVVIGLGLLGQLTAQLLRASGVKVIGVDIDENIVALAREHSVDVAFSRSTPGLEDKIIELTGGIGCDGVIIAAATDSLDPINFAGAISRKKGRIVILGAVPTGYDREPHFYKKELEVRMSCSYGPGRYDPVYEEKGIDYPLAYVRWTENRNMQAFQELLYAKKIDVGYLTTHVFPLEEAKKAYDMMMDRSEPFIGILIEYDIQKDLKAESKVSVGPSKRAKPSAVTIGFLGAGSYAQSHLLPNLPKRKVVLKGVVTTSGTSARSVAEKFGFEFSSSNAADVLRDSTINTVFIASRHDSHAEYVLEALKNGKNVFVEKPLCLTEEELEEIRSFYEGAGQDAPLLMVGYNRRFSPLAVKMKKWAGQGPIAMAYRINSGAIPAESWIQDSEIGGGRIIGEVCHFVDFLTFMCGSLPVSVYASAMDDPTGLNDVVVVTLKFEDGSVGTICYYSNGDKGLSKERFEVFSSGTSMVLEDFKSLTLYANGKKKMDKLLSQNKGQKREINAFINAVQQGGNWPIPASELFLTSLITFKVIESLRTKQVIHLDISG